ncbi:MAG: hypothetical protein QXM68_02185 [Candidatus Aenigmatarchaeota archaeon]|nr:hypothetical protein [Candidatus Aenigmarchaeota archaeon]
MSKKQIVWILIILSFIIAFLSLVLAIYNFVGKKIVCNSYASIIVLDDSATAQVGFGTLVKGKITNVGGDDEYKTETGESWAIIKPERFRLKTNETAEIYVYISPIQKGEFDLPVKIYSFCQSYDYKIKVNSV